jgi:hypothetical protein
MQYKPQQPVQFRLLWQTNGGFGFCWDTIFDQPNGFGNHISICRTPLSPMCDKQVALSHIGDKMVRNGV